MGRSNYVRVKVKREGGFTGVPLSGEFDSESLSQGEAQTLRGLIDSADFFNLPASVAGGTRGADRFQYVVTIETEDKQHTVRTTDTAGSEALHDLVDHLMKMTRRAARKPDSTTGK
jgi:hypothetical protein